MKLPLLPFQHDVVDKAIREVRLSMSETERLGAEGSGQAITLSAPTGAGKTVMAAALLESIMFGDDEHPAGDDELTVVWLSDLPNINDQTRTKIANASDRIGEDRLVLVDTNFTDDTLAPGRIYFLNTQKLSSTSTLVAESESRAFTIWETLDRTIQRNPSKFVLVIDEAHRGMDRTATVDPAVANSIVQRFILGHEDMQRSPIIVGISATPRRFDDLVAGTGRTTRRAEADVDEVRASGLIKERVVVWRPEHGLTHSDSTLLARAAQSLQDYQLRWTRYCDDQGIATVAPILVVQVEDKTSDAITATNLEHAIETIEEVVGPLHPDSYAHCFGDAPANVIAGLRRIRYLRPADIAEDPQATVVFFKTALSTGWDCPRAEVIMSYRSAVDADFIAQLVGRMVRTPLARRIDSDEVLNSVALYLPRYDRGAVQNILRQLRAGDPDLQAPIDADEGTGVVNCDRVADSFELIDDVAQQVRTYIVPRPHRMAPIVRLERLAGALSDYDIVEDAPMAMSNQLCDQLWGRLLERRNDGEFDAQIERARTLGLTATTLSYLTGETDSETVRVTSTSRSIERLFDQVGARVGAGLHEKLWRRIRRDDSTIDGDTARLQAIATLSLTSTLNELDNTARDRFDDWMNANTDAIDALNESARHEFERLQEHADDPSDRALALPHTVQSRRSDKSIDWPKHLYAEEGLYPDELNKWETNVVEEQLADNDLVCWVRNKERKSWALTIPYENGNGSYSAMYPDFLFFREVDGEVTVDLIDPHGIHLVDAPAKARGLARYADRHGAVFGRFEMVIYDSDTDRQHTLDLKSATTRRRVAGVTTAQHLADLFDLA